MNPTQIVNVPLTREEINVLQSSLDRARMEIVIDKKMCPKFREAWLQEIKGLQALFQQYDSAAALVEEPTVWGKLRAALSRRQPLPRFAHSAS